ncbi:MAG: MurT ligase domain-containing protein [Chloroflexota bacterium]|nr:MurT ligase domain-containing protein [Chloroflexota bacterium]
MAWLPDVRLSAALATAKGTYRATQLLGRSGGTAIPGLIAERVDPRLIGKLAARLPEGAIVVAGTNGKTTTARMLADILTASGKIVLNNGAGSNLSRGIAASFARQSSLLGRPDADIAVIETDEGAFPAVVAAIRPRVIVLNNLFRDQLDRYGELNSIASKWKRALSDLTPGASIVYDADDPTLCALAEAAPPGTTRVPFGLGPHDYTLPELTHAADAVLCTKCGTPLEYHALSVGHLGDWFCPTGDNARPPLAFTATTIRLCGMEGVAFTVAHDGARACDVETHVPGLYNVYNALGAAAAAVGCGVAPDFVASALRAFVAPFGRIERIALRGRRLTLALIKNPTGANEVVRLVTAAPPAPLLICINDLIADGRDVSWLWDTDFEVLADYPAPISVSGIRALDMAVRLKYAGVPDARMTVIPAIADALIAVAEQAERGGDAYVLPTYTAMLAAREALHTLGALRDVWETAERS